MKRFLMLALAATALSFPVAVTAAKAPTDSVKGPACGNIDLGVDYTYDTPGAISGSATALSTITTPSAPSCKKGTYTVYIYDASGRNLLQSCSYPGDGVTTQFGPGCNYTSSNGDPLCIYATSQGDDGHVIDTAPNDACATPISEPITPGPSGATSFH
ncbi:MAG: hypothetical protein QOF27_1413 [Gaiellaceae bacterium]|nr:hypothetical protein [Gaiellaceae bacterium]